VKAFLRMISSWPTLVIGYTSIAIDWLPIVISPSVA